MHEVRVPRLNPNDESCILVEWYCEPGQSVAQGEAMVALETSKASVDLESEAEGLLHIVVEAGEEPGIGDVIAYLFESEEERGAYLERGAAREASGSGVLTITRKARELMRRHGVSEEQLLGLGKKVVKASDVERMAKKGPIRSPGPPPVKARADQDQREAGPEGRRLDGQAEQGQALSRRQVAVGRTVSASHREIPRAFLAVKVSCDTLLEALEIRSRSEGVEVGLVEHVIRACGRLRPRFPLFFGRLLDERTFLPATSSGVGVTLDVGRGLFVPVLHEVEGLSLAEIARVLADYKFKAFRDSFDESDLEGGCISVSLNTDSDVVVSVPVIMPGQVAMVSLTAVIEEPWIVDGSLTTRRVTNLGVAYDHRVVNGADAVAFCRALKTAIERPEEIEDA